MQEERCPQTIEELVRLLNPVVVHGHFDLGLFPVGECCQLEPAPVLVRFGRHLTTPEAEAELAKIGRPACFHRGIVYAKANRYEVGTKGHIVCLGSDGNLELEGQARTVYPTIHFVGDGVCANLDLVEQERGWSHIWHFLVHPFAGRP